MYSSMPNKWGGISKKGVQHTVQINILNLNQNFFGYGSKVHIYTVYHAFLKNQRLFKDMAPSDYS